MKKKNSFLLIVVLVGVTTATIHAQVGINNNATNPDASTILDLNTGNSGVNKGFLAPQVALTDITIAAPVSNPATGLMVYSTTAPTGGNGKGYYYWSGTGWASLNSTTTGSGTNDYVARWTPNTKTLGIGMIQDNGSAVGINSVPVAGNMLYVNSTTGTSVYGISNHFGSYGLYGENDNYIGVLGYSAGAGNVGIRGEDDATGSIGVFGVSTLGYGVFGNGGTYGGYFTASAGPGVSSVSNTAAGDSSVGATCGVYGKSSKIGVSGTGNTGVYGTGTKYGVEGYNNTFQGYGLYGYFNNISMTGYGVYGYSIAQYNPSAGVYGENDSTVGVVGSSYGGDGVDGYGGYAGGNFNGEHLNSYGVLGQGYNSYAIFTPANTGNSFSGVNYGVFATNYTAATTGTAAILAKDLEANDYVEVNAWNSNTHYKIYSNIVGGPVTCAAVDLSGQKVLMHCPETPEFYYEDYGEGQLVNGKTHINIDSIYANNVAISSKHPLRVFIQLEDNENCKGVIVKNKSASGFDVVELNGGTSNTPFEWHIICNVKDATEKGIVNHTQDLRFEKAAIINCDSTRRTSRQIPGKK